MSPRRSSSTLPPVAEAVIPTKGEATRARLMEAAHTLFLRQGFHATSMRAIAEEAGIAVGGIYNHFATKEDIFAAVLDAYHPYHVLLPALDETQGETIDEFVRDAAQHVKAGIEGAEVRIMPLLSIELVEFQGRHIRQMAQKILPAFYAFVRRFAGRKGKLRAVPTPIMLRVLGSLMIGYLFTELIVKDLKGLPQFKPDAYDWFDGMIDIYLYGILDEPEA